MTSPVWVTNSGSLGSVIEGNIFSYPLNFSGTSPITVSLISGQLPPGLSLNSSGVIFGTSSLEIQTIVYYFTIRLTNISGFADRSFSITVTKISPVWSEDSNLGSFTPGSLFDNTFYVNDIGGTSQVFEKIGGNLPPGLYLNSNGRLTGVFDYNVNGVFNFTLQASLDNGIYILTKAFSITINNSASVPPIWLSPAGIIGGIIADVVFTGQVIAEMPTGGTIIYSAVGLPLGLSINSSTGVISGTISSNLPQIISFSVTARSGSLSTSRIFSLNANNDLNYTIQWITQPGSIGTISEGDKSLLFVQAQSSGNIWTRYELISGSLPAGLSLDLVTGQIRGLAQQQVTENTVFNFEIEAYNESISVTGNFSLTLIHTYSPGATRVFLTLYGDDKMNYIDLFTSQNILIGNIFQDGNQTFGVINEPEILLVENLDYPSADDIYNVLSNLRRTYLNLGKVLVGQAVINSQVVYEVLYRRIFDDQAGAPQSYIDPVTMQTIYPGNLTNIRNDLISLGFSGGQENLPLWMTSEQTIGNLASIPGWTPCIQFCYVKPGTGQAIANKINASDQQLKKLFLNRIRIDRVVAEPAADNTFKPYNILYDNNFWN